MAALTPAQVPGRPGCWSSAGAAHRRRDRAGSRQTKSTTAPASPYHPSHVLDPAGVRPRLLRSTRLTDLVSGLDPKLVSAAFGMRPQGVMI